MIASLVSAAAFADITVYGKANVSFQATEKAAGVNYTEVVSNNSRVGFKGSDVINDDLKAIYQFEYQTRVDDGTGPFSQRNIYVGLQNASYGTVMVGMFDTPTKLAQEKIDLFNDMIGDITEVIEGENRLKNIVQYSSPAFSNITLNVAYINSEKDTLYVEDGYSLSAVYNTKALYLALAADHNVRFASDASTTAVDADLLRLVGRYTVGPVVLGAMYSQYDNGGTTSAPLKAKAATLTIPAVPAIPAMIDEDGYVLSVQYNIDANWSAKAQVAKSDMKKQGGESTSVGVDYKLSKSTKLYGFYTMVEDNGVVAQAATATTDAVAVLAARDDSHLAVGIELNF